MKLRNKKTGLKGTLTLIDFNIDDDEKEIDLSIYLDKTDGKCIDEQFYSLEDFKNYISDWEEYTPEPLIKDPKIRKAVRAWAEANGIFEVIPYEAEGGCRFWYITATKGGADINLDLWGELPKGLAINRVYTIAELCGEEE